jgi:hypothetical protein
MGLANNTAAAQQQNRYAQSAGINYWAFCIYPLQCKDYHPPDSDCPEIQCCAGTCVFCTFMWICGVPWASAYLIGRPLLSLSDNYALSYGLARYLELPEEEQSRVNFTLILQGGNWYARAARSKVQIVLPPLLC